MKSSKYSVVVIGSGISGLYSALKLEQKAESVLLVTKSKLGESNSYYAQGGMVAVLRDNKTDCVELHINDTLKAGAGLSEVDAVKFISENSDKVVRDLLTLGVDFDRDSDGNFTLTKEAAHSVRRILHSGGDATGREMEIALCSALRKNKNIKVYENTMAVELLVDKGECRGALLFNEELKEYEKVYSDSVVLATGGLGQIYKYTTNPLGATGDGFALGYRAGAELRDMEFVQFHPTALAIEDEQNHNRFLISEAVRGEGAKLCDSNGDEYMQNYDERKELAPRDIVARANFIEMKKNNSESVFLNATVIDKDKLLKRFPTIAKKCAEYGIDITRDYIPVAPAAHYFMGGVKTNLCGETSVKNLYAVGEVSSTGLHGANRLASNSLLECVVCAYEAAKNISSKNKNALQDDITDTVFEKCSQPPATIPNLAVLKRVLKDTMWNDAGIFRDEESLERAYNKIVNLEKEVVNKVFSSFEEYEFKNMLLCAKLIVHSALERKESRGAHYRTDCRQTDRVAKHSTVQENKLQ